MTQEAMIIEDGGIRGRLGKCHHRGDHEESDFGGRELHGC
jgi:hypothetical protein